MKSKNWSYLAGLIDGEAMVGITKDTRLPDIHKGGHHRSTYYLYAAVIDVYNCSVPLMKWLISNFGGVYYTRDRKENWKPENIWRPKGKANREKLLLGVLPYLVAKREQALVVLEFLRLEGECPAKRDTLWQKTHILNQRGRPVETDTLSTSSEVMIQSELAGDCESDLEGTLVS